MILSCLKPAADILGDLFLYSWIIVVLENSVRLWSISFAPPPQLWEIVWLRRCLVFSGGIFLSLEYLFWVERGPVFTIFFSIFCSFYRLRSTTEGLHKRFESVLYPVSNYFARIQFDIKLSSSDFICKLGCPDLTKTSEEFTRLRRLVCFFLSTGRLNVLSILLVTPIWLFS